MSNYIHSMKVRNSLNLIGTIKEEANKFIIDELQKQGINGIVPSHGSILITLYNQKSMTMKEIAEKIKRKQPTVTVLIDKLLEYGYVTKEKDNEDSRVINICLTKKGEDFKSIFFEISEKLNKKMHKGLTEKEADTLENLLKRISGNW
jgi:MarR family transcriptional regulator, organic hydroperoxide resistance regulator